MRVENGRDVVAFKRQAGLTQACARVEGGPRPCLELLQVGEHVFLADQPARASLDEAAEGGPQLLEIACPSQRRQRRPGRGRQGASQIATLTDFVEYRFNDVRKIARAIPERRYVHAQSLKPTIELLAEASLLHVRFE